MTESLDSPVSSRIIITVNSDSLSDATIEYAVMIAARLHRPLLGVFVEDTDLLNSAALPFTREICLFTGQTREIDTSSVLLAFQQNLIRFRQRLSTMAERLSVPWSVSSLRGRRKDFHFESLSASDYCIYDSGKRLRWPARSAAAMKRWLIIDSGDDTFYQALKNLLLPLEGQTLHMILVDNGESQLRPDLKSLFPVGTQISHIPYAQLTSTLQHAGDSLDFVVVSRGHWRSEWVPLLSQLKCPLIVLG